MADWIPVKWKCTEKEKSYLNDNVSFLCEMPEDGQKIFVTTKSGEVLMDENIIGTSIRFYMTYTPYYKLKSAMDWTTDIKAWMPLPEPYED